MSDDPVTDDSPRTSSDPGANDPAATDATGGPSSESDHESDPASDSSDEWSPPPCPRCGTPVVMVTTTGPDSHYTSCGCRLTHGEATDLR